MTCVCLLGPLSPYLKSAVFPGSAVSFLLLSVTLRVRSVYIFTVFVVCPILLHGDKGIFFYFIFLLFHVMFPF